MRNENTAGLKPPRATGGQARHMRAGPPQAGKPTTAGGQRVGHRAAGSKTDLPYGDLFLVMLLIVFVCTSCTARWRMVPIESEKLVTLFTSRYGIEIEGYGAFHHSAVCRLTCWAYPIFVFDNTTTGDRDSIPIFVMDSICFEGDCLDPEFCRRSLNPIEDHITRNEDGTISITGLTDEDAYIFGRKHELIWPSHLFRGDDVRVPLSCQGQDVWMVVYARLVDRKTGATVSLEARRVQCKIKRRKVYFTSG